LHPRALILRIIALTFIVTISSQHGPLRGATTFPEQAMRPRMRCIGFNTEAEAARRFMEGVPLEQAPGLKMTPVRHHVAVILAEFPPDQDELTTGTGRFGDLPFYMPDPDSARAAQGFVVRDSSINSRSRAYYARHLLWMAQYFSAVSGGLFTIEEPDTLVDITPIIQVPNEMGYYGDDDPALFAMRQTEFVRDAIVAADTLSDLDFSQYDAVMVFHAGAGEESDFGPPPSYSGDTPNDLFSSYIPFEALKTYVGGNDPAYQGIETMGPGGSEYYVRNAIILPETIIQDGIYNPSAVYLDILGVMAHEYGHQLGLPDLNDTDTPTRPAVGNFGLMASGLFNSSGRLPAQPIAWSKLFLGWETAETITMDTTGVILKGIEEPGEGAKLLKVPISSSEYFLLENRLRDSNFDGEFRFDDRDGDNWPDLMDDDYQLDDGTYSEFDFGLPGILTVNPGTGQPYDNPLLGSGVLIWHVDDEVIRNNFNLNYTENCVNCDVFHPGIDLEEADGIQHLDETLPATIDPGYGSPFDSYGGGVEGIKDSPNTDFSSGTSPSSGSYTGGPSEIAIRGFRSHTRGEPGEALVDSLVEVDVSFGRSVAGWPVRVSSQDDFDFDLEPDVFGGNGICAADIDGDGLVEIASVTRQGDLFLWRGDGTNYIGGDRSISPFYSTGGLIDGTPAMGDLDGDGRMDIVVVSEDGSIYAISAEKGHGAELLGDFPVQLGERVTSSPLLLDLDSPPDGVVDRIIVGTNPSDGSDGKVYAIMPDGSIPDGWPVDVVGAIFATPAAGDLDRNGEVDIVAGTSSGYLYRIGRDGVVQWSRSEAGESFAVSPSLGDIDRDGDADRDNIAERLGDMEVVVGSQSGRIYAYKSDGREFGGGPLDTGGTIKVPLALGDIDGDGFVEIVALVDGERKVAVYRSNSSRSSLTGVDNFPKYVSSSVSGDFFSPPLLADLDRDGKEEIVFGTGSDLVYAYDLGGNTTPLMHFPMGGRGLSAPFIGASPGDTLAIFAADDRGMVYGWRLDVPYTDMSLSWAQEGRDPFHTAANGDSLGISSGGEPPPFAAGTFTIYPNPAPGRDETRTVKITYSLDESISGLDLDIYTLSGRHFMKIVPPSPSFLLPDSRHVLDWDITGVPSGVYILRLSIEKMDGRREHLIKKAAIVK